MSGYYLKLADTIRIAFGTSDATGAAVDADSTPTVTVYEQGTAMGAYAPTVTNKATGLYEVAIVCSGANGFEVAKEYSVAVAATVDSIVGRDGIGSFAVVTRGIDDLARIADTDDLELHLQDQDVAIVDVDTYSYTALQTVTAIKEDTDNLPADPADASVIAGLIDALPTAAENASTLLATAVDGARTLKGVLARQDAINIGKATGLESDSELATFYRADGVTKAIEAVQNPDAGTRVAAATVSGD